MHIFHQSFFDIPNNWTMNSRGKRFFDIVSGVFLLICFIPLLVTISILIKCLDGGPVLFRHERIGKDGKPFDCYKFRTMVMDAESRLEAVLASDPSLREEWNNARKLRYDPRIIPGIGRLLRKSSLDELPQVFNVLKGEMSIVGPRPVVEDELQYYGTYKSAYLSVRPGLTGPWQSGHRSDCTYRERVLMDADYVHTGTLKKDISIVFQTALKFLRFNLRGAY